jgi:hypothetical protein
VPALSVPSLPLKSVPSLVDLHSDLFMNNMDYARYVVKALDMARLPKNKRWEMLNSLSDEQKAELYNSWMREMEPSARSEPRAAPVEIQTGMSKQQITGINKVQEFQKKVDDTPLMSLETINTDASKHDLMVGRIEEDPRGVDKGANDYYLLIVDELGIKPSGRQWRLTKDLLRPVDKAYLYRTFITWQYGREQRMAATSLKKQTQRGRDFFDPSFAARMQGMQGRGKKKKYTRRI